MQQCLQPIQVRIRIFKKSKLYLLRQHALNCLIDVCHRKPSVLHRFLHLVAESLRTWIFYVKSGF